jgi:hypothetical protein
MIFLFFLILLFTSPAFALTPIQTAVAGCSVGAMCKVTGMTGLTFNLIMEENVNCQTYGDMVLDYSDRAAWDHKNRIFYYAGRPHAGGGDCTGKFFKYDDNTAAWSALSTTLPGGATFVHSYEHNTFNPELGYFYYKQYIGGDLYRYDGTSWSLASSTIPMANDTMALMWFPEMGKLIWFGQGHPNCGDSAPLTCLRVGTWQEGDTAGTILTDDIYSNIGPYQQCGIYNPVHHLAIGGGGLAATKKLFKVDAAGVVTPIADAPVYLDCSGSNGMMLQVDPVNGDLLLFASAQYVDGANGLFSRYHFETNQWTTVCSPCSETTYPIFRSQKVYGAVAAADTNDGVVVMLICANHGPSTTCDTASGQPELWIYKGTAPNVFQVKCGDPGVWVCNDFERRAPATATEAQQTGHIVTAGSNDTVCNDAMSAAGYTVYQSGPDRSGYPSGLFNIAQPSTVDGTCYWPRPDYGVAHSGSGSLKFTIPVNSDTQPSGDFEEPFKRKGDGTFAYVGHGGTIYAQWYTRFSSENLSNVYWPGTGQKNFALFGAPPGSNSSYYVEFTILDSGDGGGGNDHIPAGYGQVGSDDWGRQNVRGCTRTSPSVTTEPPCIKIKANQWMEFTMRIDVGNKNCCLIGTDTAPFDTRVRVWIDGSLAIDTSVLPAGNAHIDLLGPVPGIGSYVLWTYMTGRDHTHESGIQQAYVWFDDVIVSTREIPMATGTTTSASTASGKFTSSGKVALH